MHINHTRAASVLLSLLLIATPLTASAALTPDMEAQLQDIGTQLHSLLLQLQKLAAATKDSKDPLDTTAFASTLQSIRQQVLSISLAAKAHLPSPNSATGSSLGTNNTTPAASSAPAPQSHTAPSATTPSAPQINYACSPFARDLSFGMEGGDVTALQHVLDDKGFLSAEKVTGFFGSQTVIALSQFQQQFNIMASSTGVFDSKTRTYVQQLCTNAQGQGQTSTDWTSTNSAWSNTPLVWWYPTTVMPSWWSPPKDIVIVSTVVSSTTATGAAIIRSISPQNGSVGSTATIFGSGFTADNTLNFGSGAINHLVSNDGVSISFTVPTALAGQQVFAGFYDISVSNTNGTSNRTQFQVVLKPRTNTDDTAAAPPPQVKIHSIDPSKGQVGSVVTITGEGFTADNTILMGGSTAASQVQADSQTLEFTVPSSLAPDCSHTGPCPMFMRLTTPGTYAIKVHNDNGDSNAGSFTITGSTTPPSGSCGHVQCTRYDPVCGDDGKTYVCGEADASSCNVTVQYKGACTNTGAAPGAPSLFQPAPPSSSSSSGSGGNTVIKSCTGFTRTLGVGSQGADVTQLQQILVQKGFLGGENITGYFGSATEKALQQYQQSNGLSAAGVFGPSTRSFVQDHCQ